MLTLETTLRRESDPERVAQRPSRAARRDLGPAPRAYRAASIRRVIISSRSFSGPVLQLLDSRRCLLREAEHEQALGDQPADLVHDRSERWQ